MQSVANPLLMWFHQCERILQLGRCIVYARHHEDEYSPMNGRTEQEVQLGTLLQETTLKFHR